MTAFPLPTEPTMTEILASAMAQLTLWRLEIEASYQAADLDPDNFENFIFDLACLIQAHAHASHQPDPETAAQPEDHEPELYVTNAQWQAQAQETPDHD